MVVCQNNTNIDPKMLSPHHRDPQKGTPDFGKTPDVYPQALNPKPCQSDVYWGHIGNPAGSSDSARTGCMSSRPVLARGLGCFGIFGFNAV